MIREYFILRKVGKFKFYLLKVMNKKGVLIFEKNEHR